MQYIIIPVAQNIFSSFFKGFCDKISRCNKLSIPNNIYCNLLSYFTRQFSFLGNITRHYWLHLLYYLEILLGLTRYISCIIRHISFSTLLINVFLYCELKVIDKHVIALCYNLSSGQPLNDEKA